jgi:hypothetical protein
MIIKFVKNISHPVREIHTNDAHFGYGVVRLGIPEGKIPHCSDLQNKKQSNKKTTCTRQNASNRREKIMRKT